MSLLGTTFFKVLRKEGQLLILNASSVIASLTFSLIGVLIIDSVDFVLFSLVFVLAARSVAAEMYLTRSGRMGVLNKKLIISEVSITAIYLIVTCLLEPLYAFFASFAVYVIHITINRSQIKELLNSINARMKERSK